MFQNQSSGCLPKGFNHHFKKSANRLTDIEVNMLKFSVKKSTKEREKPVWS